MAKGRPSTALSVSNTPSPTVRPWSKIETVASVGGHQRPVQPDRSVVVHRPDPDATRRRLASLELGLGPLVGGVAVPGDAAAGAEVELPVLHPEGADGDVEVALLPVGVDPADRAAVDAAGHRLERGDLLEGGDLRRAGDRARAGTWPRWRRPTRSRAGGGRGRWTRGARGPGGARRRGATGTSTEPKSHTRPRSLRTRSTIITFSARSLAVRPLGSGAVPLIGPRLDDVAVAPRGTAPARPTPRGSRRRGCAPRRCTAPGCPRPGPRPRAATSPPGGSGAESRRVRFTWYTSPAAIDARIDRTPAMNSRLGERARPRVGGRALATAGRARGGPGARWRSGRRSARPRTGSTTAQNPCESRAARSSVRSTRSVASRPPTTAKRDLRLGGDGSGHGGQRTITPRPRRHPFHPPGKAVATRARGVHRGARRAAHGSCATSPRARSRRTPRRGTATTTSRSTSCAAMGDLGLFGIPFPEEYGGGGGDLTMLCIAIEELARVDHSMAITLEAGVGLGRQPDPPLRHRGAEADVAARPVRRAHARRLRPHRAGGGQRRRRHPHDAPCSTRRRGSG